MNGSRVLLIGIFTLGYGASMLAFRPTLMLSLPNILGGFNMSREDGGVILSSCQLAYMLSKPLMCPSRASLNPQCPLTTCVQALRVRHH